MKFLIDECLSPELAKLAHQRGYGQSSHVVWLGKSGAKDWDLKQDILRDDWTFVTRNAVDFRGSPSRPGKTGQYANVELHAGLICLGGPDSVDLAMQIELFDVALDQLEQQPDLVNQVLEVLIEDGGIGYLRYALPK